MKVRPWMHVYAGAGTTEACIQQSGDSVDIMSASLRLGLSVEMQSVTHGSSTEMGRVARHRACDEQSLFQLLDKHMSGRSLLDIFMTR